MKQHSEFVIIGGGVLGASLAYQLSLHGREVLLLEQNEICSGTSSGTVAWIGPFDRQPLFMEELAIRSFLRLFLLEHELDRPFEFTVTGSLKPLYTEKDIAAAQKAAEMGAAAGYDVVRILAPEEAWEKEPAMRGNGMIAARYEPYSAHINPFLLVDSYIQTAKRLGAEVCTFTKVLDLEISNRRITALMTDRGRVTAEHVICCAGLWSYEIGEKLGIPAPVRPNRGCCLVTEKLPPILHTFASSAHQTAHGNIIFGLNSEDLPAGTHDTTVPAEALQTAVRQALREFPPLSGVNIIRSYAGLRCKPVDGLPIIGGDEEKLQNFGYFLMHSAYSYTAGVSPLAAACFMGQVDADDPLLAQLHYRRFLYGGN